jgi:hypothetical protein
MQTVCHVAETRNGATAMARPHRHRYASLPVANECAQLGAGVHHVGDTTYTCS